MPQPTSPNKSTVYRKLGQNNGQSHTNGDHVGSNLPSITVSNYRGRLNGVCSITQVFQPQSKPRRHVIHPDQNDESVILPQIPDTGRSGGQLFNSGRLESSRRSVNSLKSLTANEALTVYHSRLSGFEREEIMNYPEIWFVGLADVNKVQGVDGAPNNNGYDDSHGSYRKVRGDHINYRYELYDTLGRGSFGQVIKAYDHKNKEMVALKIIRNKKRFQHQAAVEVKILEDLKRRNKDGRYHIIQILDAFRFRNHQCIVFELMGPNLYDVLKRNNYQGFSLFTIRNYATSVLRCLRLLQRLRIIHCDLKPENILVKPNNQAAIKVIDFGSGCYEQKRVYTYIQSRFYRAPEVILGLPYTTAIDMWSLGCILVELYTGSPLFPGENEEEQMACIMEVNGLPPSELLAQATRAKVFFNGNGEPISLTNSRGRKRFPGSKDIGQATKCSEPLFVDFISKCLEWVPERRLTPSQALQHEWISDCRIRIPKTRSSRRPHTSIHDLSTSKSTSSETTGFTEASAEADREPEILNNLQEHTAENEEQDHAIQVEVTPNYDDNNNQQDDDDDEDKKAYLPNINF